MTIFEEIAKVMSEENGTDYDNELMTAQSIARMNREMVEEERKARKVALNMKGYVPISEDSFRGY